MIYDLIDEYERGMRAARHMRAIFGLEVAINVAISYDEALNNGSVSAYMMGYTAEAHTWEG